MNPLFSWPVAKATARERGLAPATLAIAALLFLIGMLRSSADSWGAEAFSGFGGAFWYFVLVLLLGAGLLADEVESGHAQLVLLRPLTRAQWVGGRLLGAGLVLCAVTAAAWASSIAAAVLRGGAGELPGRLLVLPLAAIPALGWLATLAALSAVARSWTNAALLILARIGWFMLQFGVPLAFPRLGLKPVLEAVGRHFGPQDMLLIARQVQYRERFMPSPLLWDVFWIFAAWLVAVRLFNLRELARRRA